MMMRLTSALVVAAALPSAAAAADVADVPLYCRLLAAGLEAASFQPVLEDVQLSTVAEVPALGTMDVSASRLEVGAVKLVGCGASVDRRGRFNVGIGRLDVELKQLEWRYAQRGWPHIADAGVSAANTSLSFNVSIDTAAEERQLFAMQVAEIQLHLGAQRHTWLSAAMEKLTEFMRPLVSRTVQFAAEEALDKSLGIMRERGGCAFVENMLQELDLAKVQFTSLEPVTTHVPLVGDVNVSVNSTYVKQPTSMRCEHIGYNGSMLTAHIEDVPFSAGFDWGYQKVGSTFWHNKGSGTTDVVAGALLHIDLMQPSATYIRLELPKLEVQLRADADAWMYKALTTVMVPLVRESLQLFGGKLLAHFVAKCMADPTCPHLQAHAPQNQTASAQSTLVVI